MTAPTRRPATVPGTRTGTGTVDPRRMRAMHGAVALVAATLVWIVATSGSRAPASAPDVPLDVTDTVALVTGVSAASLGRATVSDKQRAPRRAAAHDIVMVDGKPSILYVGAEFCPYCATERWPLIVALSRFGTFSGLGVTHSSLTDVFPGTATLSFHNAAYTSTYLSFTGKELFTNTLAGRNYGALDSLTGPEQSRFGDRAANPQQAFPFLDLAGQYLVDAQFDTGALKGMTANQIARTLTDPSTRVGGLIDGSANWLTAALCTLTHDQPSAVCSAGPIATLKARLP
ncbi:MAG: hypothetical protein QOF57_970 [Frankiaceae bacterium]|nr:hypothetical protein [Frankiaceae bacterium]